MVVYLDRSVPVTHMVLILKFLDELCACENCVFRGERVSEGELRMKRKGRVLHDTEVAFYSFLNSSVL